VEQLKTMGLEILHPNVLLSPRFGQSDLSSHAQVRCAPRPGGLTRAEEGMP
jgi:hypothetical protein